jgi:tetratricopeptide (TPR) repeat protein
LLGVEGNPKAALAALEEARRRAPGDERILRSLAVVRSQLGQLDAALRDLDAAQLRDPRSPAAHVSSSGVLLRLRRGAEARTPAARAVALAPSSLGILQRRVMVELSTGDLAAARRVIAEADRDVPRERLVAYLATYWDLGWVLTPEDERLLLTLGSGPYGGNDEARATVRAQQHGWRGEEALSRSWADSAVRQLGAQLRENPNEPQIHVFLGLMHAHAGRTAEAMAAVTRGLTLQEDRPDTRFSIESAYLHYVAARTAVLTDNRTQALAWLGEALTRHYYASPAWVRLDPSFRALQGDPAFEALLTKEATP